tara:strand:+ start:265 stop:546 length:282 start_codon:yes stop_codon:yes gene_type:complete
VVVVLVLLVKMVQMVVKVATDDHFLTSLLLFLHLVCHHQCELIGQLRSRFLDYSVVVVEEVDKRLSPRAELVVLVVVVMVLMVAIQALKVVTE